MSTEENKDLVRRYWQAVNRDGDEAIDAFLSPDYVDHNPPPGFPPGRDNLHTAIAALRAAFPDTRHEIEEIIAEGNKVVTRLTAYATHTGEIQGIPPSGKRVSMPGISIHRVADGKLVEHWAQVDFLGLLQQVGAIPAPAAAAG